MNVKELLTALEDQPLDSKVLMTSTNGDLHEVRDVRFTWARQAIPKGRWHRQDFKHDALTVTAVEVIL